MQSHEEGSVRRLTQRCHPTWPERPKGWFIAHPTLVLFDGEILGATSLAVTLQPATGFVLYGKDLVVDPTVQGEGFGTLLHTARVALGKDVGCLTFIGMTWEANTAMVRIFQKSGYHACQRIPHYFKDNDPPCDGWVWVGSL
jgi:RimJ/RimL family protein N-acetyltransferase